MITHKIGNLFDDKHDYILHGCNSRGVMGSGFALQVKQMYPKVYEVYQAYCKQNDPKYLLGSVCSVVDGDIVFLNCITQDLYGYSKEKFVSYDAVDMCMTKIAECLPDDPNLKMAMPKIGAGLGGGNWEVIEAIVKHRLAWKFNVTVYSLEL